MAQLTDDCFAFSGPLLPVDEVERIIRERVNAGLARAREKGTVLGRPRTPLATEKRIRGLRAKGMGVLKIGRTLGVGTSVVQRVVSDM